MASRTVELPQSVPRSRQLDFSKAMSDFKVMFPTFDYEVIEMVLRANNGLVDATVDQLLAMQVEDNNEPTDSGLLDPDLNVRLPSYDDTGATTFEPPPAYTPRVEEDPNFRYDSAFLEPHLSAFNTGVSLQNTTPPSTRNNSQFHPPLLGTLPKDFLRLNIEDSRPSEHSEEMSSDNPLYGVNSFVQGGAGSSRHESSRFNQDARPHYSAVSRPSIVNGYDQGFDAIPNNEDEAKNGGKKEKGKRFGHMSRKFKRKKSKKKGNSRTYQQMSGANLIDEDD